MTGRQGAVFIAGMDLILWEGLPCHSRLQVSSHCSPLWSDVLTDSQRTPSGPPPAPRPHTGRGQAVLAGRQHVLMSTAHLCAASSVGVEHSARHWGHAGKYQTQAPGLRMAQDEAVPLSAKLFCSPNT